MNDIIEKQKYFFDYINNSIVANKKLSHAYLIETNGFVDYKKVILELIKTILSMEKTSEEIDKIKFQIDNGEYPDLKFISHDGLFIKKEQLIELENQYSKKSMLDNKLIYVIDPAEKLNPSSANTILKFLEEPPEDIVAILVTENKYNVLETIVSRCQCLSLINYQEDNYNEEVEEFTNEMFTPKKILIKYDYYLEKLFSDRNEALNNLKMIEELLFQNLKKEIATENYKNNIVEQIYLIEEEKERLQYNLNMKLWFSNYIFGIMEVINNA